MVMKPYHWRILLWFDQGINVLLGPLFNLFVSQGGARFGDEDETISSVFGKNARRGTCPFCTWVCRWILHPIDRNHCKDAIEEDEGDVRG